jgi:hypothetical protein
LPRRGARRRCSPGRYRASFSKIKGPERRGEDGERISGPNAATGSPARRARHGRWRRVHRSDEIERYGAPFFKQSLQGECGGDRDPVFVTSAAGEKPEGRPPWTAARSPSELADTALEATIQGIGGVGREREARGGSPSGKSQTEEARGEDRRDGRMVLRWCAATASSAQKRGPGTGKTEGGGGEGVAAPF